jgi:hypothetical protein
VVEKRSDSDAEGEEEESKPRTLTPLAALESYSGHHPETINELLEWPARRFTKAYEIWTRRKLVDEIDQKRNDHISALYSNSNYDDDKGTRNKYIDSLNDYYEKLKNVAWRDPKETEIEEKELKEIEDNDPFLKAGRRALAKVTPPKIEH